jgi:hypothetical protein
VVLLVCRPDLHRPSLGRADDRLPSFMIPDAHECPSLLRKPPIAARFIETVLGFAFKIGCHVGQVISPKFPIGFGRHRSLFRSV